MIIEISVLLAVFIVIGISLWLVKRARKHQTKEIRQESCEHDWQRDGQTMMSIRWTCTKCGKRELS